MKKIISLVLSVLVVLSCMAVPTFAIENDAKSSITEEQFGILKTTGAAIEGSAMQIPTGTIQRGVAARRFAKYGNFRYSTAKEYEALFYDLSTDNYYYYYIKGCYDNGVMDGYPDGTFRPNKKVTREEALTILGRYYQRTVPKGNGGYYTQDIYTYHPYNDVDEISDWALGWVEAGMFMGAIECEMFDLYAENPEYYFEPKRNMTRAEAAKVASIIISNLEVSIYSGKDICAKNYQLVTEEDLLLKEYLKEANK